MNWSEPNEDAFGDNEYINITPDVQYIKNTALSSDLNTWLVGIRASIAI
ncbi:carbohydrate porin [Photobacterium frigidiphilum]|nr:carbohydrate porin [Photobacterium frigidiphilum]